MQNKNNNTSFSQTEFETLQKQVKTLNEELTKCKQFEKALLEEHSFRKAVIERAAEGVCVCHAIPIQPYVQFTVWNYRMTEITGYTIEEINRNGWYQSMYSDPVIQKKAIERMEQMRVGTDLHGERWEVVRSDGQKRMFSISTALLTTDDGLIHVLGLMLDVTEEETYRRHLEKEINDLRKLFPICASCKNIRDDEGFWHQVESYMHKHFDAKFTHSICPGCSKKLYPELHNSKYSKKKQIIAEQGASLDAENVCGLKGKYFDGTSKLKR